MTTRLRSIGWALIFLSLVVLGIPWFLWGVDTVVLGVPIWIWWHVGVMVAATGAFWVFTREAWGLWIVPDERSEDRAGDRP